MLCTVGNEDLTLTAKREADAISDAAEYDLSHMMSIPIEPNTPPRMIDLEHDSDALLYGH